MAEYDFHIVFNPEGAPVNLWTVLLIGVALFVFLRYFVTIRRKDGTAIYGASPTPQAEPSVALDWPALGNFDFGIVGESNYQDALKSMAGNHGDRSPNKESKAVLIPEDDNRYDRNAIRVAIDGRTVGYLSRDDAPRFRRRLGAKKVSGQATRCEAMIVGGFIMKSGDRASYGVMLDIKPFD